MNRRGFLGVLAAAVAGRKFFKKKTHPLPMPYGLPETGLSIRIIRTYDPNADRFVSRMDVLYGIKVEMAEHAAHGIPYPPAFRKEYEAFIAS